MILTDEDLKDEPKVQRPANIRLHNAEFIDGGLQVFCKAGGHHEWYPGSMTLGEAIAAFQGHLCPVGKL